MSRWIGLKISPPKKVDDDEEECVVLTAALFQKPPSVVFENIGIGTCAIKYLYIHNPARETIKVKIRSPPDGYKITIIPTENELKGLETKTFKIMWQPELETSFKYNLKVDVGLRLPLSVNLLCESTPNKLNRQRKTGVKRLPLKRSSTNPGKMTKEKLQRAHSCNLASTSKQKICHQIPGRSVLTEHISDEKKIMEDISPAATSRGFGKYAVSHKSYEPELMKRNELVDFSNKIQSIDDFQFTPGGITSQHIVKNIFNRIDSHSHLSDMSPINKFNFSFKKYQHEESISDMELFEDSIEDQKSNLVSMKSLLDFRLSDSTSLEEQIDNSVANKQFSELKIDDSFDVNTFKCRSEEEKPASKRSVYFSIMDNPAILSPSENLEQESSIDTRLLKEIPHKESNVILNISPHIWKSTTKERKKRDGVSNKENDLYGSVCSTQKKVTENFVQVHSVEEHLADLAAPNLFTVKNDPFLSKDIYRSKAWINEQEVLFLKWLNNTLTAPIDSSSHAEVNIWELWGQSNSQETIEFAKSKEEVSLNYLNSRLDSLRKASHALFRSQPISLVLSNVTAYIDNEKLYIRQDRNLCYDLGLRKIVADLILNYSSLWLRIGLENVFGTTIHLASNTDTYVLRNFIMKHLLSDPTIDKKYSHPSILRLKMPGYEKEMKKYSLQKFLQLVYFLDKAKEKKLIAQDPCLFRKNSPHKASKNIILEFSRELIGSVGDVLKVLKSLGYIVSHVQSPIDEYDFRVTKLADLRNGVCLSRLMEIILQKYNLSQKLRVPAISILQKVHNVNLALGALTSENHILTGDINARDIVDGHRQKTLSLIWQILHIFLHGRYCEAASKLQKWWRKKFFKLQINKRIQEKKLKQQHCNAAITLQRFWRSVLTRRLIKKKRAATLKIQTWFRNLKLTRQYRASFLIKKGAAIKIQLWYRSLVKMQEEKTAYMLMKKSTIIIQRRLRATLLMRKDQHIYKNMRYATEIIQNWYRSVRLMCHQRQQFLMKKNAALTIQRWFRNTKLMNQFRTSYIELRRTAIVIQAHWKSVRAKRIFIQRKCAAVTIQRWYRSMLIMRTNRESYLLLKTSTLIIQTRYRALLKMQKERRLYLQLRSSTLYIQNWYRSIVLMREQRCAYVSQRNAVLRIQGWFRATQAMLQERTEFNNKRNAAIILQAWWKQIRTKRLFNSQKIAAIKIQRKFRALMKMQKYRHSYISLKLATIVIQRWYRAIKEMHKQKRDYLEIRTSTVTVQRWYRNCLIARKQRSTYVNQKGAVLKIQRWFRSNQLMLKHRKAYDDQRSAAKFIQSYWRGFQCRKTFIKRKHGALRIQRWYRSILIMRTDRETYLLLKKSTLIIQTRYRALLKMQKERRLYLQLRSSTLYIQNWYRSIVLMREERHAYVSQRNAVLRIQGWFRATQAMLQERSEFNNKRNAAIILQAWWKQIRTKRLFNSQKIAAIKIQRKFRALMKMQKYRHSYISLKLATIVIQKWYRAIMEMYKQKRDYLEIRTSTVTIQRWYRNCLNTRKQRSAYVSQKEAVLKIQRWFRSNQLMSKDRKVYNDQRSAAKIIQSYWRGFQCRKTFIKRKHGALRIQRWYRSILVMRTNRESYLLLKKSAIIIQTRYRALIKMQQHRRVYLELRSSTLYIQNWYRGIVLMHEQRQIYLRKRKTVLTIQSWFRGIQAMLKEKENFINQVKAAITIQSAWKSIRARRMYTRQKMAAMKIQMWYRATVIMRKERETYNLLKRSVLVIQNKYRATLLMRKQLDTYVKLKSTVLFVERTMIMHKERKWFLKQKMAAEKIKRWYKQIVERVKENQKKQLLQQELEKEKQISAAVKIQALVRGYLMRKKQTTAVKDAQRRIFEATHCACDRNTLRNRYRKLFKHYKEGNLVYLGAIINALEELDKFTWSNELCKEIALSSEIQDFLFCNIVASNRSVPYMTICSLTVKIYVKLAERKERRNVIWRTETIPQMLFKLLHIWQKNSDFIFSGTCKLIYLFSQDGEKAQAFLKYPNATKILRNVLKTREKLKTQQKRGSTVKNLFDDPFCAIKRVFTILHIQETE